MSATTLAPPPQRPARRTLAPWPAYVLVTAVIGLALFASATPSPLYATYRELWGFSPTVLTLVFAVYAFGVLGALLLAGGLAALFAALRPVTAVFVFCTWAMLLFVLLPYLGALRNLHEVKE